MNIYINRQLCKNISNFQHKLNIRFYYNLYQTRKEKDAFYFGTIEDIRHLESVNRGMFSNKNDNIIDYLPFIQRDYLNFDGAFYRVDQLSKIPNGDWFCRSNSGNKILRGQRLTNELIDYVQKTLKPDDVLYVSTYKEIDGEMRFWCIENNIIEYSSYCSMDKDGKYFLGDIDLFSAIDYVHKVNQYWMPCNLFVIDICKYKGEYKVVEYNGFSTSGFYNANLNKICEKLEQYLVNK